MYEYKAICTRVVDGDTLDCEIDLGFDIVIRERVRFAGINAPESRTRDLEEKKRGLASKARVMELCGGGTVFTLKTQYDKHGRYGRVMGRIILENVECLNDLLVEEGHAVPKDY